MHLFHAAIRRFTRLAFAAHLAAAALPGAWAADPSPDIEAPAAAGDGIVGANRKPQTTGTVVYLSSLDLAKARHGASGPPGTDKTYRGKPLMLGGVRYKRGVGVHAPSTIWVDAGGAQRFDAVAGVDDGAEPTGSVRFSIYGDGRRLWQSGILRHRGTTETASVSLVGIKTLLLKVDDGQDRARSDFADWADARFLVDGMPPRTIDPPESAKPEVLTPPPGPAPRLNNAKVYGCRPGNPFLYRIPATGARPMKFRADGLPATLKLDEAAGIIRGASPSEGSHEVALHASNAYGSAQRRFRIASGSTLALTPYMGWNHWYMHHHEITDARVRSAADAMIASGMADAGYCYVGIDDCWMNAPAHQDPKRVGPLRDGDGFMVPNGYFPNMKALTDYIHSLGLKAGIYSSPGPLTCAKFCGSYGHEAQDAETFAQWGFDLLKYDFCSYRLVVPAPASLEQMQEPYRLMGGLLLKQKRDIVFNLCQYGRANVWEWGRSVHAQSWRTARDLGSALDWIFEVAVANAQHRAYQLPGAWNDPDYLQAGKVLEPVPGRPSRRGSTATEQYSFMSLWCLSAAPLVFSGDMDHLDAFTTGILCNPEVIEVDQDPLGQCASVTPLGDDTFLMVKELEDGAKAVGLCNSGEFDAVLQASWTVLGLQGKQAVRDLWRHKDLGVFEHEFAAPVPRRGVLLVRIGRTSH